jgi:hypothetical protein
LYSFVQASPSHYINGTQSNLGGLFTWMGGFMPPSGPTSNTKATAEIDAWVAAGALDN